MIAGSFRSRVAVVSSLLFILHAAWLPVPAGATTAYSGEDLFRGLIQFRGPVAALIPEIAEIQRLVPELIPAEYLTELQQEQEAMIVAISTRWPEYWDEFEAEIESGDHLRVQVALHQAYQRLLLVLAEDPEFKPFLDEIRDSTEAKAVVSVAASKLGQEILLDDVDRLLEETKLEGGSSPIGFCLALNLVLVVNAAVYFNAAIAQNIWRYVAIHTTMAIRVRNISQPVSLLPELLAETDSVAFQARMNSGRLAAERMIDNIVKVLG